MTNPAARAQLMAYIRPIATPNPESMPNTSGRKLRRQLKMEQAK